MSLSDFVREGGGTSSGKHSRVPPPPLPSQSRVTQSRVQAKPKPAAAALKGYFDESDEDEPSPSIAAEAARAEEGGEDPLDAFMASVEQKVMTEAQEAGKEKEKPAFLDQDDAADAANDRFAGAGSDTDSEAETAGNPAEESSLDADGYPTGRVPQEKKKIEPLPPVDHSSVQYEPFRRDFYAESPEIKALGPSGVAKLRRELGVAVEGDGAPSPIQGFSQAGFDASMVAELQRQGIEAPTPIQAQAIPVALKGRDMIGVAKTGSGKTFAYLLPCLTHVMAQREISAGEGPIAIILAPTRELAAQIYAEAKKFARRYDAKVCAVFGGAGKWEMQKALKEGPEVVVATPGRLIEMMRLNCTNALRCTFLVLDEADRMFDMGFEYQVRSIVAQIRPDRQTLLFSATFKRKIEALARDILSNPIRVNVGSSGGGPTSQYGPSGGGSRSSTEQITANEDVRQEVAVLPDDSRKWGWLRDHIAGFVSQGKVLVFVASKQGCEELCASLRRHGGGSGIACDAIHGDRDQTDREKVLRAFRHNEIQVLVGTDVASRGLDIKDVNTVVNFDAAKSIETHVHRVGRTGRMTKDGVHPGTAYTLVTPKQAAFAADLCRHLESARQVVSPELRSVASNVRRGGGGGGGGGGGIGSGGGASSSYRSVPPPAVAFVGAGSGGGGGGNGGGSYGNGNGGAPAGGVARAGAGEPHHHIFSQAERAYQDRAPWSPASAGLGNPVSPQRNGSNPGGGMPALSLTAPAMNHSGQHHHQQQPQQNQQQQRHSQGTMQAPISPRAHAPSVSAGLSAESTSTSHSFQRTSAEAAAGGGGVAGAPPSKKRRWDT